MAPLVGPAPPDRGPGPTPQTEKARSPPQIADHASTSGGPRGPRQDLTSHASWISFLDDLDSTIARQIAAPSLSEILSEIKHLVSQKRSDVDAVIGQTEREPPPQSEAEQQQDPEREEEVVSLFSRADPEYVDDALDISGEPESNIDLAYMRSPVVPRASFTSTSTALSETESVNTNDGDTPGPASVPTNTLVDAVRASALKMKLGTARVAQREDSSELNLSLLGASLPKSESLMVKTRTKSQASMDDVVSTSFRSSISGIRASPREHRFARSFPNYRMLFSYSMKSRNIFTRAIKNKPNSSLATAISPLATYFTLATSSGEFSIYAVDQNFNEQPAIIQSGVLDPDAASRDSISSAAPIKLAMTERWAVFGHRDVLRVVSIHTGAVVYEHSLQFSIQALAASSNGAYIACAVLGLNRETGESQPMLFMFCPNVTLFQSPMALSDAEIDAEVFAHIDIVTFSSPYRDLIKTVTISPDEKFLMCSTGEESRFFVISLSDTRRPRVVMRSLRKVQPDSDKYVEGITCTSFFPRSSGVVVTSVAPASPPIIIDSKLNTIGPGQPVQSRNQSFASGRSSTSSTPIAAPSLVMRVEKVGSAIHSAEVSPREDAVAFLDKSGLVYVLHWPNDGDFKKVVVCCEVSGARQADMAASMRFSPDGTVLFVLDRKGYLYIADFGAGTPQTPGMSKLRVLS